MSSSSSSFSSPRVVYLRDDAASRYDLAVQSPQHPMKPWRLTAVHALVRRLGLFTSGASSRSPPVLTVLTPLPIPVDIMNDFHLNEYVSDLERTSGNSWNFVAAQQTNSNPSDWVPFSERAAASTAATSSASHQNATNSSKKRGEQHQRVEEDPIVPEQQQQQQESQHSRTAMNNNISGGANSHHHHHHHHSPLRRISRATTEPAPSCFSPYDCPVVQGALEYSRLVAGSSLYGAVLLNADAADTVINWAGGMHHARAGACSGFCYVNDCVIAIRELLRKHRRVLYIDIDVHHGDGVEEAFYDSDRVFTMSLHKFCDGFFPGTGHPADVGVDKGRYFNLNVPLRDGVRDEEYLELFNAAFSGVTGKFGPDAIVLQCGADSLAGDRLGGTALRLSSEGHAACVRIVRDYCSSGSSSYNDRETTPKTTKLLVLGGGGYSIRHLSRLWAYETAVLCGMDTEIHSRMVVPLPTRTIDSGDNTNNNDDHTAKMWHLLELLKAQQQQQQQQQHQVSASPCANEIDPATAIQIELEERALMLVFADELMTATTDTGEAVASASSASASASSFSCPQPTCSLYVAADGGGFEGRQHGSSIAGPGALFRFVQTVVRQIENHTTMLGDAMAASRKQERRHVVSAADPADNEKKD